MNRSETLTKIAPALVAALAEIGGVVKGKANPAFKGSKYADLESVIAASKPILSAHGLVAIQLPGPLVNGVLTLETVLMHESGEYISGDMGIALGKIDPQGVGSAISYSRRYSLMAALNMPAVDDDAEAAHGRSNGRQTASAGEQFVEGATISAYAAKKTPMGDRCNELKHEIATLEGLGAITAWANARAEEIKAMPEGWRKMLREELETQKALVVSREELEIDSQGARSGGEPARLPA
jgi:hypothetical protein